MPAGMTQLVHPLNPPPAPHFRTKLPHRFHCLKLLPQILAAGDIIEVTKQTGSGWWQGVQH